MEKISLRSVDLKTRTYIKKQTVRLHLAGKKHDEIVEALGISYDAVSRIVRAFKRNGSLPKEKTKGRKKGEKRTLSAVQEKEIQRIIIDRHPDQMKLGFALWTRAAVRQLVHDLYGIDMPLRSVSNYLDRWGLTCQRPTRQACVQDDVRRKNFMEKEYPAIATTNWLHFAWSDGINNREHHVRGFSPKGTAPVLKVNPKLEKINMISAISSQGTCRFMCYEETMTQQRFIDFMRRLVKDARRKVFLIVDNLKVHHGKLVKAWLEENRDKIEVFYTPTYSPDLNPDEYLNNMLKQSVHSGTLPRSKKDLRKKTASFMRGLQKRRHQVVRIFDHKKLAYIKKCCA